MPKKIKITFSLICLSSVVALIIAALSDAEIIQAAMLLLINGFIFMALFTIKYYSDKNNPDFDDPEKLRLFNELEAAKKLIQSHNLNLNLNLNQTKTKSKSQSQSQDQTPLDFEIDIDEPEIQVPDGYVHQSVLPNYEISFTPQGSPRSLITNFINSATKELYIAQFNLYENKTLIDEIISAKRRGIDVRVLVDYEKNSKPNSLELLKSIEDANIPVYRNTNYSAMKHSFMIADGSEIQFGNAFGIDQKSVDSLLVFKNARNMVDNYRNEFLRLANEPQHESVMCSNVGCYEGGVIIHKTTQLGGHRWQCSTYDAKNSLCQSCELLGEEDLERQLKGKKVNVAEVGCDHQGEVITWMSKWDNQEKGEFNQFWACSGRNKNDELCQRCSIKGDEDKPERIVQPRAGDKCPLCKNGVLKIRRDNFGKYVLGCGNYPACKYPEGLE